MPSKNYEVKSSRTGCKFISTISSSSCLQDRARIKGNISFRVELRGIHFASGLWNTKRRHSERKIRENYP